MFYILCIFRSNYFANDDDDDYDDDDDDDDDNNNNNNATENRHIGHYTHTSESTNVKVQ